MPKASDGYKLYKVGKEIIEARHMGEALGLRRAMAAEGKASAVTPVVEHLEKGAMPTWGKTNVIDDAAKAPFGQVEVIPDAESKLGKVTVKETPKPRTGKVVMMNGIAAPGIMNPMESLQNLGDAWQQNVVDPISGKLKETLTPEINMPLTGQTFQTASPASNMIIDAAADPINYVPGPAGAALGAAQAASQFAEGGEVEAPDEMSLEAFQQMSAPPPVQQRVQASVQNPVHDDAPDEMSIDDFESREDKFGGTGQQAITALEGLAEGVAGPLATLAEKHVLRVPEADILARREENPIAHGTGQAVGLVGGLATGVGEAAIAAKVGAKAAQIAGLAQPVRYAARVGSEAVKQAAEMAIISGSDEASKMILNDPNQSVESAMANVGLGTALGGAGGAAWAGIASPLWKATAGKALDTVLARTSKHLNGEPLVLPEKIEMAVKDLGLENDLAPEMRAALSTDKEAQEMFLRLREAQKPEILEGIEKMHHDAAEKVAKTLGVNAEDVAVYSDKEAGQELLNSFKKEWGAKYEPIETAFNKRNADAAVIEMPERIRVDANGQLLEKGMESVGMDSPLFKLYEGWGERLMAKGNSTVGKLDRLRTELGGELDAAIRAGDTNKMKVYRDIRQFMGDLQEQQINRVGKELGEAGVEAGARMLEEREATNKLYRDFMKVSEELSDNLNIGKAKSFGAVEGKLSNKVTPEQLLKKFSTKNNAEFIPFLQQHFPETLQQVLVHERKEFLKPAIMRAKGELPLNSLKLSDDLAKAMAGKKEYIETLFSPEQIKSIESAAELLRALPDRKSSGTAGWMTKMYDKMPASALAAIAMLGGKNPIIGGLLGHTTQVVGINAPNAMRLSYLKFLGSSQPIKAEGFKAMVDFIRASAKGETMAAQGVQNLFKAGAQTIPDHAFPSKDDNEKLDKKIAKMQEDPKSLLKTSESDVGHYLPGHQLAFSETTTRAVQYLQSIKPQPHKPGVLDKDVPPLPSEVARYQRALSIANQPLIVLDRIKNGTLQASDIKDLNSMYPALYQQLSTKIINEMGAWSTEGHTVPYKTRMGISLFLGTPVDSTMNPNAIVAAQPKPQNSPPPLTQQGANSAKGAPAKLGKTNKMYMTQGQAAEADRAQRK